MDREEESQTGLRSDVDIESSSLSSNSQTKKNDQDSDSGFGNTFHHSISEHSILELEGSCKEHNRLSQSCDKKGETDHRRYSWGFRAEKDRLTQKIAEDFPKFHKEKIDFLLDSAVTEDIMKMLSLVSAYTITNYFGSPCQKYADQSELMSYLCKLIPLGTKLIRESLEKARLIQRPELILFVKIREACSVKHITSDKFGHPFCKVWLSLNPHNFQLTERAAHYNHPVWNMQFYFPLKDPGKDILHIEVWDSCEESCKASQAGTAKDCCWPISLCGSSCCDKKEKLSTFIGKTEIEITKLYTKGTDEWLILKSLRRRNGKGKLHIRTKFGVASFRNKVEVFKRHMLLLKICFQDGLKQALAEHIEIKFLDELLQRSGMTLAYLHSVISGLTPCEDDVCKFIVLCHLHTTNDSVSHKILFRLLNETSNCLNQDCLEGSIDNYLEDMYKKKVENLHDSCFNFLNSLHSFDLVKNRRYLNQFEHSLRCIHICEEILSISSAPHKTLKLEACDWLESKGEELNEVTPDNKAEYLMEFLDYLISFHEAADKVVKKVFPQETYTDITFDYLDELNMPLKTSVISFVRTSLKFEKDDIVTIEHGIKLFSKIKCFVEYVLQVTNKSPSSLKLSKFRSWFDDRFIEKWFGRRKEIAVRLITDVVNGDCLKNLTATEEERLLQKESVKMVCTIIEKNLTELWKLISNPRSLQDDALYLNAIHVCCLKYYTLKKQTTEDQSLVLDSVGEYKLGLCILANNLWDLSMCVGRILSDTVGDLPPYSVDSKTTLQAFCRIICGNISAMLMTEITPRIDSIASAETQDEQNIGIEAYQKYCMNKMSGEIASNLSTEVYVLVQQELWNKLLELIDQYIKKFRRETEVISNDGLDNKKELDHLQKKQDIIYRGFLKILTLSKSLCFVDEEGKLLSIIESDLYKSLIVEIEKKISNSKDNLT